MLTRYIATFAFFLAVWPSGVMAQQPAKSDTARVTGRGATRWDARADAIRQALQQKVAQLVIADRAVSFDSVLKDDVISTVNGFVEGFEILAERSSGESIELDALVVVSEGGMERFFARKGNTTPGKVDGDGILASIQAIQAFEASRAEILNRLLNGFPTEAVDLVIENVLPDAEKRYRILVFGRARIADGFVRQLKSGFDALAQDRCPDSSCRGGVVLKLVEESGRVSERKVRGIGDGSFQEISESKHNLENAAMLYHGDKVRLVRIGFKTTADPSIPVAMHKGWEKSEKALCYTGDGYFEGWYSFLFRFPDNRICLPVGDRQFVATVEPQFLEGAKDLRAALVPVSLYNACASAKRETEREIEFNVKSKTLEEDAAICFGGITKIVGKQPATVLIGPVAR
jgi:hypothetical protein